MNHLVLAASSEPEFVLGLARAISEYGVLVVIAAVYLCLTLVIIRRLLSNYTNAMDSTISEIRELRDTIQHIQKSFNEVMSTHNAHSNQSLKTLERGEKDVREILLDCQKTLNEVQSELIVIRNNHDNLFRLLLTSNHNYMNQITPRYDITDPTDYDESYKEESELTDK